MHVVAVASQKYKKGVTKQFDTVDPRLRGLRIVSDLINIEELVLSANFVVKDYKDSFYAGEANLETKEREGLGVCSYRNKRHFEGSWHRDKRHGKGHEIFSNGNVYVGEYD
jgi:hypothetical protein